MSDRKTDKDLRRLLVEPNPEAEAMLAELEGREPRAENATQFAQTFLTAGQKSAPDWTSRFLASGGKQTPDWSQRFLASGTKPASRR